MRFRIPQSLALTSERFVRHRLAVLLMGAVVVGIFVGASIGFACSRHAPAPDTRTAAARRGAQVSAASTTSGNQKPRPASATDIPAKASGAMPSAAPAASAAAAKPAPTPPPLTPASILGLANWKLALPIDTPHAGKPDEITQPELTTFSLAPYFELAPAKNGVIFQAHAGGATTKNSSYPRSELREMAPGGTQAAAWGNAAGTHTMVVREAITHLPTVKPEVVAAQIHDASDDVVMVKLSGSDLFVEAGSKNIGHLDTAYVLGTPYTVKIVATGGHIFVYYNDVLKVDYAKKGSGWYFKAGCYTQSNPSKGDAPDAFAQVVLYSLAVSHT